MDWSITIFLQSDIQKTHTSTKLYSVLMRMEKRNGPQYLITTLIMIQMEK